MSTKAPPKPGLLSRLGKAPLMPKAPLLSNKPKPAPAATKPKTQAVVTKTQYPAGTTTGGSTDGTAALLGTSKKPAQPDVLPDPKFVVIGSSQIAGLGYDLGSGVLSVKFTAGGVYDYEDVDIEVVAKLVYAAQHREEEGTSVGKEFDKLIKKGGYRFAKRAV